MKRGNIMNWRFWQPRESVYTEDTILSHMGVYLVRFFDDGIRYLGVRIADNDYINDLVYTVNHYDALYLFKLFVDKRKEEHRRLEIQAIELALYELAIVELVWSK